jgi:hypothetical protein
VRADRPDRIVRVHAAGGALGSVRTDTISSRPSYRGEGRPIAMLRMHDLIQAGIT